MYILAHVGLLAYRPNLCICNPNTKQSRYRCHFSLTIWTSVFASYSIRNQIATWLIMQSVPELIEEPLCSDINVILTEMAWQYILAVAFSGLVCQHQLYSSQWIMFHWIAQSFEYSKHLITGKQIVSPLFLFFICTKLITRWLFFFSTSHLTWWFSLWPLPIDKLQWMHLFFPPGFSNRQMLA